MKEKKKINLKWKLHLRILKWLLEEKKKFNWRFFFFRITLEERQNILLREFDNKFQEFENERLKLENVKFEVERYKNLLIKQKDIMITLTSKLNERDESILQL